jgi:alginate O-acetyltransferase complex protein AlgI
MVFSSPLFLFLFLPIVLAVHVLLPGTKARNFFLLLASLLFYAWGEIGFVFLLLASTSLNYFLGRWVERSENPARRKLAVAVAVIINVGLLAFFKYASFVVALFNSLLGIFNIAPVSASSVPLPVGISFFTFHALSYVIDVYRRKWRAAASPQDVALYIFFFPQLIAGPILRWSAIGPQLLERVLSREKFADGIRRFTGGLAKKVLIANTLALPADQIFSLPAGQLSLPVAWLGVVCYTLQIYFDFSGYSDMAVGLGKMFGFQFLENFNFPYIAQSVRGFWQRWHISLSTWFRDYLYIPLGGSRISETRTCLNLLTVFFLCGLWHGASLAFVVWGLYHGFFLALERTRLGKYQERLPQTLRHSYTVLVVMMGWVIFRADTLTAAGNYFHALFASNSSPEARSVLQYLTREVLIAIALGILFATPFLRTLGEVFEASSRRLPAKYGAAFQIFSGIMEIFSIVALLVISAAALAGGTYNPFIYFRF